MATLYGLVFIAAVVLILDPTDGATTYINSPGYPLPYKPISVWRTSAPVKPINGGMRVKLTVTMMDLAYGDTVGIYDGSSCDARDLLETFKGTGGPHPHINKVYFSTANTFCIVLRAPTGYGKGFSMKTEEVFGCQGIYNEDKGDIISPGFPIENYETSRSCRWSVSVDQGQRIEYKVMELDFDPGNSCPTFLTLSGVQADYTGKICQSSMQGKTIVSTSTDSDVIFKSRETYFWTFLSHEDSRHRGFWLAYKAIGCKTKLLPESSDTTGHHINKNKYYANLYIAKYACNPGYWYSDKNNENLFTCHEDGQLIWSGSIKQCVEIRCGNPPVTAGGKVSLSNEDKINSVATYACNTNFIMDGKDKRTCLDDGTWSGKTPDCKVITCPNLSKPSDGKMVLSGLTPGNTAAFSCNLGFDLIGPETMKCAADGSWPSPPPFCSKVVCPVLPKNVTNAQPMSSAHKYLDVVVYRCDPDFFLDSNRSITEVNVTCQADGVWSENITGCWYRSVIHPTWGNGCRFVPTILSYKVLGTWFDPSVDACKDKCIMNPMCSSFTAYKYGSFVSCMLYSERENQGQRLMEYRKVCH